MGLCGTVFAKGLIGFQIQLNLDLFLTRFCEGIGVLFWGFEGMTCVKLGSKADAFHRQGQAWYLALSFCLLCTLQFCCFCFLSLLSSNVMFFLCVVKSRIRKNMLSLLSCTVHLLNACLFL